MMLRSQFLATVLAAATLAVTSSALAQPPDHRKHQGPGHDARHEKVTVEEAVIRAIFRADRQLLEPRSDLPPGIRKNLARGKPLPPGLAKRFDHRLEARLPHYPGYEWRQLGRDAVLVAVTTGVVEAILDNIFD
jgi:Ni/Co efflux regulator RcnB